MEHILVLKNLRKTYPGVVALDDVSINVRKGEVLALIGENGAGKSTMIKAVTGALQPDSGDIIYEGNRYGALTPLMSRNMGIAAIYQEFTLAPSLPVAENIFMGQRLNSGFIRDTRLLYRSAEEVLSRFNVDIDPRRLVRDLTVASKQLVEIAKAIAKKARFIIMDEPTAPLTENEVDILFDTVHRLKAEGVTIIYISHRLDELFQVSDRVTVMRDGQVITTGDTNAFDKQALIHHMVGRKLTETFPARNHAAGETALEVKNITGNGVQPVSFSLRAGEIFGFAGLVGAGRTELARLIFGADPKEGGSVYLNGKPVDIRSPKDAVDNGISLVPEDRKQQGVLLRMDISSNIVIPILRRISRGYVVDTKKETDVVKTEIDSLDIRTPSARQLVQNLSGGNQQKVVLGKWLASDCKILILDEPTRGIDVGAKQEIYKLVNTLAKNGLAIIVISSEMEEILNMTDRMLVLFEGRFMGELSKDQYSQSTVLQLASGETINNPAASGRGMDPSQRIN
jgi:ribose transport system ATP-binding protein